MNESGELKKLKVIEDTIMEYYNEAEEIKNDQVKQFYKKKKKFPQLTNKLLNQAISEEFLEYDQKDSIIKDPNLLSIFFVKVNSESPYTKKALEKLQYSSKQCSVIPFEAFFNNQEKPLKNLVDYMFYLTKQYKVLEEIFSVRNKFKKEDTLNKKRQRKPKFIPLNVTQDDSVSVSNVENMSPTLFKPAASLYSEDEKMNRQSEHSQRVIKLITPTTVVYPSYKDRLQMQSKKQEQFHSKYLHHLQKLEESNKTVADYYLQKVPQFENKVTSVQTSNQKIIQEKIFLQKLKEQKIQERINKLQELEIQKRMEKNSLLQSKEKNIILNRSQIHNQMTLSMVQKHELSKEKEKNRLDKKIIAEKLEQTQIEQIQKKYQQSDARSRMMQHEISIKRQKKKEQSIMIQKRALDRVVYKQKEIESNTLQQYGELQTSREEQLKNYYSEKDNKIEMFRMKLKKKHQDYLKRFQMKQIEYSSWQEEIKERVEEGEKHSLKKELELYRKVQSQIQQNKQRFNNIYSNYEQQHLKLEVKDQNISFIKKKSQSDIVNRLKQDNQKFKELCKIKEQIQQQFMASELEFKKAVEKYVTSTI